MRQRPIVFILIAYLTGLGLDYFFNPPLSLLIISACVFIIPAFCLFKWKKVNFIPSLICIFIAIACLAGGWSQFLESGSSGEIKKFANAKKYLITGRVTDYPADYGYRRRVVLAVDSLSRKGKTYPVKGNIRLDLEKYVPISYGDEIAFYSQLRPPPSSRNPGVFDYRAYLESQGIWAVARVYSAKQIISRKNGRGNFLLSRVYKVKDKLSLFLRRYSDQPAQGLLRTIILGEKCSLDRDVRNQFTDIGIAHLLAISGSNLSCLAFSFICVFNFLLIKSIPSKYLEMMGAYCKPSQITALLCLPVLAFYVMLAGMGSATMRAAIMLGVYLLSVILETERDLFNILGLAALLILIPDPGAVLEVDFQLSFVIVFFIIYTNSIIKPVLDEYLPLNKLPQEGKTPLIKRFVRWIITFLAITISANIAALPLTAYHFHHISLTGLVSNLAMVIPATFLTPLGLFAALASLIHPVIGALLLIPSKFIINLMINLGDIFTKIPNGSFYVFPPTIWQVLIALGLIYLLIKSVQSKTARLSLAPVFIAGAFIFWTPAPAADNNMRVAFIDVGEGDAAFVEFPNGRNMIIDGGGAQTGFFDTGANILAPFLRYKRIKRIDTVVLTHSHPDHMCGLKTLLDQFEVGEVWEGKQTANPEFKENHSLFYRQFIDKVSEKKIPRRLVSADDIFQMGEAEVRILHPPAKKFYGVLNNSSLVLKISYKEVSFLFAADIIRQGQKYMVKKYRRDLESTIIKVPHHGAKDGFLREFVNTVNPQAAVFPVGLYNKFRHPYYKALGYYKRKGIKIFRSDRHGAVTVVTDGRNYSIEPYVRDKEI